MSDIELVIKISEKDYKSLNRYINFNLEYEDGRILSAVKQGVVLPENLTNGDMIKAMFPNQDSDAVDSVALLGLDGYVLSTFPKSWWNSPYKRGDEYV